MFDNPANAQTAVKGMILVNDGSAIRSNSRAHEYSKLLCQRGTFAATLPNGKIISGLSSQLITHVNYVNPDIKALIRDLDAVSAEFTYARPILAVRREQLIHRAEEQVNQVPGPEKVADKSTDLKPGTNPSEAEQNQPQSLSKLMETAMSPTEKDLPFLTDSAKATDSETAKWGIRGLGKLGSHKALSQLISLVAEPATAAIRKREVVKQFTRIAQSGAPENSSASLKQLKSLIDAPETDPSVKDGAIQGLVSCAETGDKRLKDEVNRLGISEVDIILVRQAEANQRAEEWAAAFTPDDQEKLTNYSLGPYVWSRHNGVRYRTRLANRLFLVEKELEDREAQKRGELSFCSPYDKVNRCWNGELVERLKKEKEALESGDPYQIAMSALLRVQQLAAVTDFNTPKPTANSGGIDITGRPYTHVSANDLWGNIAEDGARLGEFLGSQMSGVFAAMDQARLNDIIEAAEMLSSLSPTAKARIGIKKK